MDRCIGYSSHNQTKVALAMAVVYHYKSLSSWCIRLMNSKNSAKDIDMYSWLAFMSSLIVVVRITKVDHKI